MRIVALALTLMAVACRDQPPQAPSSAETEQLDDAESMLNDLANEEGPEQSPGPSNQSN